MNKKLRWLAFGVAFMGMGITMPQCPGQQAMQQQIDQLTTSNADLNRKVQNLNGQIKGLNDDMGKVKELLQQMTNAIQAQKTALDGMDTTVKDLQAKVAASARPSKSSKSSKGKKRH